MCPQRHVSYLLISMKRIELDIRRDALAVVEFSTMPAGLVAADSATKASDIHMLFSGTVHPGKFLLAFEGGVAETELGIAAARRSGRTALIDSIHLPFPHPQLRTVSPTTIGVEEPALLAVETLTVPSLLGGLDRALKSTMVVLRRLQLADDLGGKSIAVLEGSLPDIEASSDYLKAEVSSLLLSDIQLLRRPTRQFIDSFIDGLR